MHGWDSSRVLWAGQAWPRGADREHVGYEQAIARRNELQGIQLQRQLPGGASAGGAAANSAQAAIFQQQLAAVNAAAGLDPTADGADSPMAGLTQQAGMAGTADPYAMMQGNGLGSQASVMAQLQGLMANGSSGISATQLQGLLGGQGMAGTAAPVASAAPQNVTGKTANLDPELLGALDQLGARLGVKLDVISGNRTREEQAALYQKYLNGTGNLAAPPGQSNHEHGDAADVYVNGVALANVPGAREAAKQLGLHFPVGGEAWHVEVAH